MREDRFKTMRKGVSSDVGISYNIPGDSTDCRSPGIRRRGRRGRGDGKDRVRHLSDTVRDLAGFRAQKPGLAV